MIRRKCPRSGAGVAAMTCLLLVGGGCDGNLSGELADLTGAFLGDVVSTVTSSYFRTWVGADGSEGQDTGALHNNDH